MPRRLRDAIIAVPDRYTAVVEANFASQKFPVHWKEWSDGQGRTRTDTYDFNSKGYASMVCDATLGRYYRANATGCVAGRVEQHGNNAWVARTTVCACARPKPRGCAAAAVCEAPAVKAS